MGDLGFLESLRRAARGRRRTTAPGSLSTPGGTRSAPPSGTGLTSTVVLHFHGGGFVSQSVDTHQHYLRLWANATDAYVLSVDYTLAAYPQALLECFMVYRWLIDGHLGVSSLFFSEPLSRCF
jgi:hormone-sensitive lipase